MSPCRKTLKGSFTFQRNFLLHFHFVSTASSVPSTTAPSPAVSEEGPALLPKPRRWCCGFWIGSSAVGPGPGPVGPRGAPRDPAHSRRVSAGILGCPDLSAALQNSPCTSSGPPEARPGLSGCRSSPREASTSLRCSSSPVPVLYLSQERRQCLPPLRSPSSHQSPPSPAVHTGPPAVLAPPGTGSCARRPGAESIAPFSSPQAPGAPRALPAAGTAPRGAHRPLGGQAPLRVFAPRRDAAGRVILLLFTAFFLHLELK